MRSFDPGKVVTSVQSFDLGKVVIMSKAVFVLKDLIKISISEIVDTPGIVLIAAIRCTYFRPLSNMSLTYLKALWKIFTSK